MKSNKKNAISVDAFLRKAGSQLKRCCFPTVLAVTTSVIISKVGLPVAIPVILGGAGFWAWKRGYRVQVETPDAEQPNQHNEGEE